VQILLSYFPIKGRTEINTHLMSDYLAFRVPSLVLAYPVIDQHEQRMKAILVNEETEYTENEYGIEEPVNGEEISPADIDMIFVPLLAFDTRGYRVGYGKGFYDRFLPSCNENIIKVGFSYFEPVDRVDDIDDFDVPLSLCITPNKLYEF
jgi:5-formyltetrahydrofolate cyclo-ligase